MSTECPEAAPEVRRGPERRRWATADCLLPRAPPAIRLRSRQVYSSQFYVCMCVWTMSFVTFT